MSVRRPKVVVIDDSEIVLEVTQGALEGAGYDVITHDRPAGCVALILHEKPDLVLMDVQMPGLGGDTIVSVFAKAQPNGETVVLLHSSLSAEVLRTKAAAAGAHGYIQKSGDLFGLVREVNRWMKRLNSSGHMRAALALSSEDGRSSSARPVSGITTVISSAPPVGDSGSLRAAEPLGRRTSATMAVDAAKVLLVDDDMTVLSAYRRQLQAEDIVVEFALSGSQALRRMLSDTPPDIVICDMLLPDISGVDVYQRAVASQPSYRQRFAVATGASGTPAVAAFLASFSGPVLYKPVESNKLIRAIRTCLAGGYLRSNARG